MCPEPFRECSWHVLLEGSQSIVAHVCGDPLSRSTCRATRVAADFLRILGVFRCSSGIALHPPPLKRPCQAASGKVSRYRGCSSDTCGCRATLCNYGQKEKDKSGKFPENFGKVPKRILKRTKLGKTVFALVVHFRTFCSGTKIEHKLFFLKLFGHRRNISQQNPGISSQKSLISLVSRDIPKFLAPTHSRGRSSSHPKTSGPNSLVWVPFSSLICAVCF